MRILCAGGGSGGHVTPVVAVLNEVARLHDQPIEVVFVCDRGFETQTRSIMATADVPVRVSVISAGKLRRYKHFRFVDYITTPSVVFQNFVDGFKVAAGTLQALWVIARWRPNVVFAKGGFVCLPVGWAARILRVPIVIHDSDARPGLTNRLLAPFAAAIATGYPLENYSYDPSRSTYTGVPIAQTYSMIDESARQDAKSSLGVARETQLIVGMGGGLGAETINRAIIAAGPLLRERGAYAVLVAGSKQFDAAKDVVAGSEDVIDVRGFVQPTELSHLLAAADIVVTRASATSLQELAGMRKPVIAVPARQLGDQHKNAAVYKAADAAVVLSDDDIDRGALLDQLDYLLADGDRRKQLGSNLSQFARPQAARDVAQMVIKTAKP